MPIQIRGLLKQVRVVSSIGNNSTETSISNCYITIPSIVEVNATINTEPYASEGTTISYMTTNSSRKRAFDNGAYYTYWTRSPYTYTSTPDRYVYTVEEDGDAYGFVNASQSYGVLIMISF